VIIQLIDGKCCYDSAAHTTEAVAAHIALPYMTRKSPKAQRSPGFVNHPRMPIYTMDADGTRMLIAILDARRSAARIRTPGAFITPLSSDRVERACPGDSSGQSPTPEVTDELYSSPYRAEAAHHFLDEQKMDGAVKYGKGGSLA
jgi:hypothetical protein